MTRIRYYAAASLDGYVATEDDSLDWLMGYQGSYEEGETTRSYDAFYAEIGAVVMGSTTYEWLLDHLDEALEELGEEAGTWPYAGRATWVLSSRELPQPPGVSEGEVRIISGAVEDHIEDMLESAGDRDLWIVGGGPVASQFAEAGRLDTLELTVVPVVLGSGKPLFERGLPGEPLQLTDVVPMASGMVELRYARSL